VRNYLTSVVLLFATLAVVIGLDTLFSSWWDLPDESMLGFFAACAAVLLPVRVLGRRLRRRITDGTEWARQHLAGAAGAMSLGMFVFLIVWGIVVSEAWWHNLAISAALAIALFAFVWLTGLLERSARRRAARNPERAAARTRRTKRLVRVGGMVWLAVVAIIFVAELSDALSSR
jgi:hypothetical protein